MTRTYPDVFKIAAYIPISASMIEEIRERREAMERYELECRIGPLHGPPIPAALAMRRRLTGHPAGHYRRHAS